MKIWIEFIINTAVIMLALCLIWIGLSDVCNISGLVRENNYLRGQSGMV